MSYSEVIMSVNSNSTNLDTIEMTSKESNQQLRSCRRKGLK